MVTHRRISFSKPPAFGRHFVSFCSSSLLVPRTLNVSERLCNRAKIELGPCLNFPELDASDIKNSNQVFANLYSDEIYKPVKKPKFQIGDRVRISKYKRKLFDKGFTPNWTEEIFVIDGILNTKPVTYRLVDLQGEAVTGSFYEPELQKNTQEIFRIEEVIHRDKKQKRALVKWSCYPDKFNSWIPISELNKL